MDVIEVSDRVVEVSLCVPESFVVVDSLKDAVEVVALAVVAESVYSACPSVIVVANCSEVVGDKGSRIVDVVVLVVFSVVLSVVLTVVLSVIISVIVSLVPSVVLSVVLSGVPSVDLSAVDVVLPSRVGSEGVFVVVEDKGVVSTSS